MAIRGWVYVITNKAMPGLLKVGYTMKDPDLRARELGNTGSPHSFVVAYEVMVEEPRQVEQTVHSKLSNSHEGKEWFRCSLTEAVTEIRKVVGAGVILETVRGALKTTLNGFPSSSAQQVPSKSRDSITATQINSYSNNGSFEGKCSHCGSRCKVTPIPGEDRFRCPICNKHNYLWKYHSETGSFEGNCSQCGSHINVTPIQGEDRVRCPICNTHNYPRPA